MPRRRLLLSVAVACTYGAAGTAWADGSVGGSLDVTSDYIFHGLSQSDGDPAVQGDIHYRSESDRRDGRELHRAVGLDASAATQPAAPMNSTPTRAAPFSSHCDSSATARIVHYAYPNGRGTPHYDYDETLRQLGVSGPRLS